MFLPLRGLCAVCVFHVERAVQLQQLSATVDSRAPYTESELKPLPINRCGFQIDCFSPSVCVFAGQVMTAGIAEILNGYSLKAVLRQVSGEKHTRAAEDTHDDSYLGNMH